MGKKSIFNMKWTTFLALLSAASNIILTASSVEILLSSVSTG